MSLPRFAEIDAVEVRIGRQLAGDEVAQCEAFLDEASTVIRAETGRTWAKTDPAKRPPMWEG